MGADASVDVRSDHDETQRHKPQAASADSLRHLCYIHASPQQVTKLTESLSEHDLDAAVGLHETEDRPQRSDLRNSYFRRAVP